MLEFKIRIAFFVSLFILLLDTYLWVAIRHHSKERKQNKYKTIRAIFWTVTVLAVTGMLSFLFVPGMEQSRLPRMYFSAALFVIYFSKLVTGLLLLLDDLRRFALWVFRKIRKPQPQTEAVDADNHTEEAPATDRIPRSVFLSRTGVLLGGVPFVMMTKGLFKGAYDYRVRNEIVYLPNLPQAFDGLKLLQISDIHSGSFFDTDKVAAGINLIKEQKADLVFFTGDMVNNRTEEMHEYVDLFAQVKAPMGVFSTLGNHDYGDYVSNWKSVEEKKQNLDNLCYTHKDIGWRLLRNEHEVISRNGQKLGIIGVENWGDRGRFQKFGDVQQAMKGMEETPVKLLLSHDPSHWDAKVRKENPDIDMMFSGHTHGMQFGIEIGNFKWSPIQYMYKQWAGLYQEGNQYLYVNRGFGFLGYPGRVGILPEITVFTLKKG